MDRKDVRQDKLFNIADRIKSNKKCNQTFVTELKGWELKYSYFQEHGFENPLLIKDKSGLGMRVPSQNFTMNDIKKCVGSKKVVQVLTSKGERKGMTMKEFTRLSETKREDLSALERFDFLGTKLETYVEQPEVVRLLDWANFLTPSDGDLPEGCLKVQRFCSMTLPGHFDNFNISLPSQWIHLLHGKIVLWLIQPSSESYQSFSEWKRSPEQTFLGDEVVACQRLKVEHGWTLLIPSGWITAHYTIEDALTIGGTFLNSFSVANQIGAYKLLRELNDVHVDNTLFSKRLWHILDSYLTSILGQSRQIRSGVDLESQDRNVEGHEKVVLSSNEDTDVEEAVLEPEDVRLQNSEKYLEGETSSSSSSAPASLAKVASSSPPPSSSSSSLTPNIIKVVTVKLENCLLTQKQNKNEAKVCPTKHELEGMRSIVEFLLDEGFSSQPSDLHHHDDIISDAMKIFQDCSIANQSKSVITGRPIMSFVCREGPMDTSPKPPSSFSSDQQIPITDQRGKPSHLLTFVDSMSSHVIHSGGGPSAEAGTPQGHPDMWSVTGRESVLRRRRVRCKKCEPCTRGECGECHFCRDMKKFGGQGKMKQTCISRQCLAPILSTSAVCSMCGKGDHPTPSASTAPFHQCQNSLPPGDPAEDSRLHLDQGTETSTKSPSKSFDSATSRNGLNASNELMECSICWKITHPLCFKLRHPELAGLEPVTNEDLPNSWDCPGCCEAGKSGQKKPRPNKSSTVPPTSSSSSSSSVLLSSSPKKKEFVSESEDEEDDSVALASNPNLLMGNPSKDKMLKKAKMISHSEPVDARKRSWNESIRSGVEDKRPKMMSPDNQTSKDSLKVASSFPSPNSVTCPQSSIFNPSINPPASSPPSSEKIKEPCTSYPLGPHAPQFVVRPIFSNPPPKFLPMEMGNGLINHPLTMEHWLRVFGWLGPRELSTCMLVCRTWNTWCYYSPLWRSMDVSRRKIKKVHLIAVAKRQPEILVLSHASISRDQMLWLMERLFRLRRLKLEACPWSAISCLCSSSSCPVLTHLDLSWVSHLNDLRLKSLLSSPTDSKPGVTSSSCRLQNCVELKLVGTEIGDASLELISKALTKLQVLDLSYCIEVTCKALEFLANRASPSLALANQQTPSKHQPQLLLANKQHQSKYSPVTVQGGPSSHQPLAAVHNPCIQSTPSSSSPAVPSTSQQDQGTPNATNSNICMIPNASVSLAPYHDLMLPLPQLQKLFLIGCSWLDGTDISEARIARPQMEIIHSMENL